MTIILLQMQLIQETIIKRRSSMIQHAYKKDMLLVYIHIKNDCIFALDFLLMSKSFIVGINANIAIIQFIAYKNPINGSK